MVQVTLSDMALIDEIERVCFGVNIKSRDGLHRDVINKLKSLFIKGGYKVRLEYPICFNSRIRKSGDCISRNGNLDLFAVKKDQKVAIEFDTGVNLKFKSIEKLFQAEANLCIAIVRGNSDTLDCSIERVEQLKEEYGFLRVNLWVIILSEKIAHKA